ncbi:hypothetical protein AB0D49_34275 [Streptomyces sp. NPDC048290]|uniref:hypothetical protein n=1 Tax=Streptomyces sp. NPDC048290 TaxID=3155811 RepID=UPI0034477089
MADDDDDHSAQDNSLYTPGTLTKLVNMTFRLLVAVRDLLRALRREERLDRGPDDTQGHIVGPRERDGRRQLPDDPALRRAAVALDEAREEIMDADHWSTTSDRRSAEERWTRPAQAGAPGPVGRPAAQPFAQPYTQPPAQPVTQPFMQPGAWQEPDLFALDMNRHTERERRERGGRGGEESAVRPVSEVPPPRPPKEPIDGRRNAVPADEFTPPPLPMKLPLDAPQGRAAEELSRPSRPAHQAEPEHQPVAPVSPLLSEPPTPFPVSPVSPVSPVTATSPLPPRLDVPPPDRSDIGADVTAALSPEAREFLRSSPRQSRSQDTASARTRAHEPVRNTTGARKSAGTPRRPGGR